MNGLIGNTPMIKIKYKYKEKENFIYAKLEWFNLTGSIKDRLIYYVLNKNNLENITTLVEATSGNTGIALAALGNYYKKKVVIFMPDFVSEERKILLKSFGAKLHLISKKDGGFVKCVKLAKEYARKKDVLLINQFSNKLNIDTHYNTTAKEILNKLNNIGGFVSGVGSGGTLMGVTNRLKEVFPNLKVALVEPKNSEIINKNKVNSHKIEGIADDFIPDNFKKENICGQAFDFYEFINCVAIIEGCSKVLFKIFNLDLNKVYPSEKAFKISNKTRQNDLAFFSFIRSAASMHPAETNAHNKITKHKFEVYPYAIWCNDNPYDLINTRPNEANIELLSWNCKTNGKYKYYFLVIDEFFDFIKNILVSIKFLIPVAENIVKNYKETINCKRLKKIEEFDDKSMYCLYLREKIQKKLKNNICPDGGLLLASHILKNQLIGSKFKKYIINYINKIVKKMMNDISLINYDEMFENFNLFDIIDSNYRFYINEKFFDYLRKEVIKEITENKFVEFKEQIVDEKDDSDCQFVIKLLTQCNNDYINESINKAKTYCDLYELILEQIYLMKFEK